MTDSNTSARRAKESLEPLTLSPACAFSSEASAYMQPCQETIPKDDQNIKLTG